MEALVAAIRRELTARADPARGEAMARYLKYQQPCLGINAPAVEAIVQEATRHVSPPPLAEAEAILRDLWNGRWREERYAALRLAERWRTVRIPEALPLLEWMVVTGGWWDLVDGIAARLVGPIWQAFPGVRPRVCGYIAADDLWLRRTALLCQLKLKGETDAEVLGRLILRVAHEKAFFIRKAIGWALREYGKTDPAFVRGFVADHGEVLSALSRREALRNLAT